MVTAPAPASASPAYFLDASVDILVPEGGCNDWEDTFDPEPLAMEMAETRLRCEQKVDLPPISFPVFGGGALSPYLV